MKKTLTMKNERKKSLVLLQKHNTSSIVIIGDHLFLSCSAEK